jgi:hypothetical protein
VKYILILLLFFSGCASVKEETLVCIGFCAHSTVETKAGEADTLKVHKDD